MKLHLLGRSPLWAVVLSVLLCAGCGAEEGSSQTERTEDYPKQAVELVAPAGHGGGYDVTLRCVAQCLQETGLVSVPLPVTNMPGQGGGAGLQYLSDHRGSDNVLAVFSPPVCLINLNGSTDLNYRNDTTPIAMLITDYGCFCVRADSPYQTITDVMQALKEDPKSVRVGGTSAEGSMDHVQFLEVAMAAGVENLDQISYEGFEDGGAPAQLLGGHVDLISSGISDMVGLVESGDVRVLAITASERADSGITAQMPTCIEQGIDATFYTWRGIFGPPDMPAQALQYWESTLGKMVQSKEWKDICKKYGWEMNYLGYQDFQEYLDQVNQEYAQLLEQVGLLREDSNYTGSGKIFQRVNCKT